MYGRSKIKVRPARRTRSRALGGGPELLESRQLLATFVVTNTGDLTVLCATVPGSLRAAIEAANANPGPDTIKFNIGGTGPQTIVVAANCPGMPLPAISDQVTINGLSQGGSGYGGPPLVQLVGTFAGAGADGLRVEAPNTVINGLAIDNFSGNGMELDSSGATIQSNYIGLDPTGTIAAPNGENGVFINSGSNNTVGGVSTVAGGTGNVISGNGGDGVLISFGQNNRILGNQIGSNVGGDLPVANTLNGVEIQDSSRNQIGGAYDSSTMGGTTVSLENQISGNKQDGILISGLSSNTSVQGNVIGLDPLGTFVVPNGANGIENVDANQTTIGGVLAGAFNVISGNTGAGILINGSGAASIQGNDIGTDITGLSATNPATGNGGPGVEFLDSSSSTVGGTAKFQPNVIAFNGATTTQGGVFVTNSAGGSTSGISILNNSIFSNVGAPPLPGGIQFKNASDNGGISAPGLTNVVSGAGKTLVQGTLDGVAGATYTLQFFSNPAPDPSGSGQGKTLVGQATVTTNSTGTATINATISSPTTVGSYVAATATDSQGDTSEFSNALQVGQASLVDLAVAIAVSPKAGTVNAPITYTLTATNNSSSTATNVVLVDTLPASVTYQSSSTSAGGTATDNGQMVTAVFPTIPAGGKATLTIVGIPSVTGTVVNTATISSNEIDPATSNNTATVSTPVNIPADLGVTATASPSPQIVGQSIAYTIIVTNNGPGPASNATITDQLPSGVVYVSASSGQGTITQANGLVTANLGTLPVGVSAALRILVTPSTSGTISNTATVASDESDTNTSNNSATVVTTIEPAADLVLTGSANPATGDVGNELTYILKVVNSGPSTADSVNLTDLLPTDAVYVSGKASQGTVTTGTGTVKASLGTLAPLATATIMIVVIPTASEVLQNGATVSSAQIDPNTKNNTITISTPVSPADVAVAIAADPAVPLIGQDTTLNVTVTNNGPSTASNVVLTDILPGNATYVGAAPPKGILSVAGNTLTVQFGSILSGQSVVVPIVITPNGSGSIVDTASVTNPEYDPNPSNNSATYSSLVSPADLGVSASANLGNVLIGGQVVYTVNVINNGPAVATNVVLGNPVPAGFQFLSATTTSGSIVGTGSTVFASIGTLNPGAAAQVTFVYQPTVIGTFTSTFSVNADQTDPNPSNSTSSVSTTVYNVPGEFDLSAASYSVSESAGSATVTITRNGGTQGAASVVVNTAEGTGVPGFDYTPIAQTVNFADGQTSATVTIPIIDNGRTQPNTTVGIFLSSPTGGATIGAQSSAILTIVNTHPDLSGPQVLGVLLQGNARAISSLQIGFNTFVNADQADNIANYLVTAPNGRAQAIKSAVYDPTTNIVTLTFARPLATGRFYQLVVNGSSAGAITGASNGTPLDGDGNGVGGGNYVATFERAPTIKYSDSKGNIVTFRLQKGGYLDLVRFADGDGQILTINGARPYRSVLSGTVKASGPSSTGVTTLQAIDGLDPFGSIQSTLTSPPFVVGNTPILSSASLVAEAIDSGDDFFPASLRKKHS